MFIGLESTCATGNFAEQLSLNSKKYIKCISINNRPCLTRPRLININANELFYYQFPVSVNKCGGICNTIDDPHVRKCVPNKVKNMNVKILNWISSVSETRFLVHH